MSTAHATTADDSPQRSPGISTVVRAVAALVLVGVVSYAAMAAFGPRRISFDDVVSEMNPLVRQLKDYRAAQGAFPADLKVAGITPPRAANGEFSYELRADGHCSLYFESSDGEFGALWISLLPGVKTWIR